MQSQPDPHDLLTPADPAIWLKAVDEIADGIAATLHVARALADTHRPIDLAGLNRMVGVLCARALDLPPEQGRMLRPRLLSLLADLDALSVALQPP